MAAANSSAANERVRGGTAPEVHNGDRLIWDTVDGARIYIIVKRVNRDGGVAYLRCHWGGKAWTRRHLLPLFPSMTHAHWTTADLLETR